MPSIKQHLNSRGYIHLIEVQNFKSYKGLKQIGPFGPFTAVVGPNGSGKSNLMDAIGFVLGVQTDHLRGRLVELLHRGSDEEGELVRAKEGYVKMVFVDSEGVHVNFSRTIISSGRQTVSCTSQYMVDDKVVGRESYVEHLASYGVLVKARNFLVFQGDIESVAQMNPKALTTLVEQISGSASFAREYEELQEAMEKADQEVQRQHVKKKTIALEKRQVKEQKTQAEQHMALEAELKNLKRLHFEWQAFHIEKDIEACQNDISMVGKILNEAIRSQKLTEDLFASRGRDLSDMNEKYLELEQEVKTKEKAAESTGPEVKRLTKEIKGSIARIKKAQAELDETKKNHKEQGALIDKVTLELSSVHKQQSDLEEVIKREERSGLKLGESDLQEYKNIKQNLALETSVIRQTMAGLECQLSGQQDAVKQKEEKIVQLEQQISKAQEMAQMHLKSANDRHEGISSLRKEQKLVSKERHSLSESNRRAETLHETCMKQISDLEQKINHAQMDRFETYREQKLVEAVEQLKEHFPGVYGRITDLGAVTQRDYNLAVTVAMMKDMDSVVVDTFETAQQCIQHLKDNRISSMVFLPLAGLRQKVLDESLRDLGGTAKLAIDLIEFDKEYMQAFIATCGNTVVCNTTEEARKLYESRTSGLKVVSMDGTLLHKTGLLTGGKTRNIAAQAARWSGPQVQGWRTELETLQEEVRGLPSIREGRQEEQRMSIQIDTLGRKIAKLTKEIGIWKSKAEKKEVEVEQKEAEVRSIQAQIPAEEESVELLKTEIEKTKEKMDGVADKMFADFSHRLGIQSYRDYEEQHIKRAEELTKQKAELASQAGKLSNRIEYERSVDWSSQIGALEEKIEKEQENVQALNAREKHLKEKRKEVLKELEKQKTHVSNAKSQLDSVSENVRDLRKAFQNGDAKIKKLSKDVQNKQAGVHDLTGKRDDVLKTAAMELGEDFTPDPSCLRNHHRATITTKERTKLNGEFEDRIEELGMRLARAAPNLKALEQFNQVVRQEQDQQAVLEEARRAAWDASQKFNTTHSERLETFMEAYNHIDAEIARIYSDLTKSEFHPLGGFANLYLENTNVPFREGIKFTPIPPGKRYRQVEQLSGGEKTVAALALLFAIHSFRPSPFFILDEIDASLDATNVTKVAGYIVEQTKAGTFQGIVISLKDIFYSCADSLVGVARDPGPQGSTLPFTLDLSSYPPE